MGSTETAHLATGNEAAPLTIDPFALIEVLTGRKIDRQSFSSNSMTDDFEDLSVEGDSNPIGHIPSPDAQPEDVHVGVINPYALVEAILGHQLDTTSTLTASILSDVLQTDYEELFDMKYNSALFAGLKLDHKGRVAQPLSQKEIKILTEKDLVTPDFSRVQKLQDLEKVGLKDLNETRVTTARMQNGKLRLVLEANSIGKRVTNSDVTMTLNELAIPFRKEKDHWQAPNSSWEDAYDMLSELQPRRILTGASSLDRGNCPYHRENSFDNPVQGASTNSWFIAALFSVFWADPSMINRAITNTRDKSGGNKDKKHVLSMKFHDKGGRNNGETTKVEVNYDIVVNNSSTHPIYCHSTDGQRIWPSLYEKAYTKWITGSSSDHPDITQTHNGDPVKAMAQIDGKKPQYYFTNKHSASELLSVVRASSINYQTLNPMVAWTYATGNVYKGSNLVANHAYSVLGWASHGDRQYIILRNPWGVTEPLGLSTYPGLMDRVEREFWPPACLLDNGGLLALEAFTFKEYFACLGLSK